MTDSKGHVHSSVKDSRAVERAENREEKRGFHNEVITEGYVHHRASPQMVPAGRLNQGVKVPVYNVHSLCLLLTKQQPRQHALFSVLLYTQWDSVNFHLQVKSNIHSCCSRQLTP